MIKARLASCCRLGVHKVRHVDKLVAPLGVQVSPDARPAPDSPSLTGVVGELIPAAARQVNRKHKRFLDEGCLAACSSFRGLAHEKERESGEGGNDS